MMHYLRSPELIREHMRRCGAQRSTTCPTCRCCEHCADDCPCAGCTDADCLCSVPKASASRHTPRWKCEEVVAEVEHLLGTDGPASISARLGYSKPRYLARVLHRAGRHDLATNFKNAALVAAEEFGDES